MEGQCRPSKAIVEEKINVTVRLRPLNEKEMNSNDYCAWKCVDEKTIVHVDYHNIAERASFPQFYFYGELSLSLSLSLSDSRISFFLPLLSS